jgi:hypothetical protein
VRAYINAPVTRLNLFIGGAPLYYRPSKRPVTKPADA